MATAASSVVFQCQFWMRCCVAIEVCVKEALLDLLHDQSIGGLPSDKHQLYIKLLQFKRNMSRKLSNIKPSQWDIMCHQCTPGKCDNPCPKFGQSDSNEYDIQCIAVLIIYLVVGLAAPVKGWRKDPDDSDQSKSSQVLRARRLRNSVMHLCLTLLNSEAKFNHVWEDTRNILQGLGYQKMDVFDELKTCSLDPFNQVLIHAIQTKMEILKNDFENRSITKEEKNQIEQERVVLRCSFNQLQDEMDRKFSDLEQNLKQKIEMNLQQIELQRLLMEPLEDYYSNIELQRKLKKSTMETYQRVKMCLTGNRSSLNFENEYVEREKIFVDATIIKLDGTVFSTGSQVADGDNIADIRTKIDQIITKSTKVEINDLVQPLDELVIICGVPGSGKTMLTQTLLYKWSINKLWHSRNNEFEYVFMIPLKDLHMFLEKEDVTAGSILEHFYPGYRRIISDPNVRCLLILDGFDELLQNGKVDTEKQTLYTKAVNDLICHFKSAIITTRPGSFNLLEKTVLNVTVPRVTRFYEIVGFDRHSVKQYIEKHMVTQEKKDIMQEAFQSFLPLYDVMCTPFMAWAVCDFFQKVNRRDVTSVSYTLLYTNLFLKYIHRLGYRRTHNRFGEMFEDRDSLTNICSGLSMLAHKLEPNKMNQTGRVYFNEGDIPMAINIEDLMQKSGLLIKIKMIHDGSVSYQFLNYAFQEFLLALHVYINGSLSASPDDILHLVAGLLGGSLENSQSKTTVKKISALFPTNNNFDICDILRKRIERDTHYITCRNTMDIANEFQNKIDFEGEEIALSFVWFLPLASSLSFRNLQKLIVQDRGVCIGHRLVCFVDFCDIQLLNALIECYSNKEVVLYFTRQAYEYLKKNLETINHRAVSLFASFSLLNIGKLYTKLTGDLGFVINNKCLDEALQWIAKRDDSKVSNSLTLYISTPHGIEEDSRETILSFLYKNILKDNSGRIVLSMCHYPTQFDLNHRHTTGCISNKMWAHVEHLKTEMNNTFAYQTKRIRVGASCLENPLTASNVYTSKNAFAISNGLQIFI